MLQESGKVHIGKGSLSLWPQTSGPFAWPGGGLPGQQMLPAWQAGAGEGYGRNFGSEASLVPEQGLGWAGPLQANKGQRAGRLGAPWFPDEP